MSDHSPADYPHLVWRRLQHSEARGTPTRNVVPPQPPLRSNQRGHGQAVARQMEAAIQNVQQQQQASGIDATRLLVLEMEFLQASQREALEKLGLQIVDEEEARVPLESPYFPVPIKFQDEADRDRFAREIDSTSLGIERLQDVRGSNGSVSTRRLEVCFADPIQARSFWQDRELQERFRFDVNLTPPVRKSWVARHRVLVQFPDMAALDRFRLEQSTYANPTAHGALLPPGERSDLFDAIETVRARTPLDRTGERLRAEGVPDRPEFAIDVDLWHPGNAALVAEMIRSFQDLVRNAGGRVTDGPYTVAESVFLARVKGSRMTLDAIRNYSLVAVADLPPRMPVNPLTIFDPIEPPPAIQPPSTTAPLACVVDSGVLPGHPLLSGWVLDGRDFDSGDGTPVDLAGHGTHVAGIVVYGDVHACLREHRWEPRVRVLNAKVLRNNGGSAEFSDTSDERVESQLRTAICTIATEYGCRVFNLSLGHPDRPYRGGRQLPWAMVLDELARELNVVIVVSVGNVPNPQVPSAPTEQAFREAIREQLLTEEHDLIDPGTALLALTVGSIARTDRPFRHADDDDRRTPLAGSPCFGPSPFTRSGRLASSGAGVGRAIKPELVAFGGNYYAREGSGSWVRNDPMLGQPSTRHDFATGGRLLSAASGTSAAAPYVTHVAAIVEHALRFDTPGRSTTPSANLIRALVVHSATVPPDSQVWVGAGQSDALARCLRLLGYGMPDPFRAVRSTEQRVVLVAEDELEDGYYHVYEVEVPAEFLDLRARRTVKITLAYDPPVRGTRKEYLCRKFYFRFLIGVTLDQIVEAAQAGKDLKQPPLSPGIDSINDSTVQSAVYARTDPITTGRESDGTDSALWYVVVRSEQRLDTDEAPPQRYALVLSLEHSDQTIRLYQRIRERARIRRPG